MVSNTVLIYKQNLMTVKIHGRKLHILMRARVVPWGITLDNAAISIASRRKIRHLPVVDGARIVGMITFRDLVSYLLPEICYMAEVY